MKRAFLIGFAACAFALAPALSALAVSFTPPDALGVSEGALIQIKGGHGHGRGHMGRGNRGRHLGWTRGRHRGWR